MGHHADSPKSSGIPLSPFCPLITWLLSSCPLSPDTLSQAEVLITQPSPALAPSPTALEDGAAQSYPKPHCGACGFIFFFISLATSNRVTLVLCLGKANSGCPSLGVTLPGHTQWVWGRRPWGCGAEESGAWEREPRKPSLVFHVEPRPRSGVDLGRDTVPAGAWSGLWDRPYAQEGPRPISPADLLRLGNTGFPFRPAFAFFSFFPEV